MSLAERGAYITLLAYQWDTGSIPDDRTALARIFGGCSRAQAEKLWAKIGAKFRQGSDGLWRNMRLESERHRQAAYREAQRANGKLGGRPKK
jgi:uncharacterized protein YdaU (DUF1376 family)